MSEYEDAVALATALHKSRLWRTGSVEQALAVILMGRELGIGPTTALSNIQIAMGKPTLGAALVGALIQRSGRYRYVVTELNDQAASIDFFEQDTKIGTSTFTMQDAVKAGLGRSDTWAKYGRNMLMARALTNGTRWFSPGVLGGAIYDPEELGVSGVLAPPEGENPDRDATPSVPASSQSTPSEGAAVDAGFVPNGEPVTIDELLATWTAEEILEANDGQLPQTDEDLARVAAALHAREEAATGGGS